MNKLQEILASMSDDDLANAIFELETLGTEGILPNGVIRKFQTEIREAIGITIGDANKIVVSHVYGTAARKWVALRKAVNYAIV